MQLLYLVFLSNSPSLRSLSFCWHLNSEWDVKKKIEKEKKRGGKNIENGMNCQTQTSSPRNGEYISVFKCTRFFKLYGYLHFRQKITQNELLRIGWRHILETLAIFYIFYGIILKQISKHIIDVGHVLFILWRTGGFYWIIPIYCNLFSFLNLLIVFWGCGA